MKLIQKIKWYLTKRTKIPKCFKDDNFMYCWCGKCVPDEYELPQDMRVAILNKTLENYFKKLK